MTLNTYIAGDPASGHALADFLTRRADTVHDKATGWHDARATAEAEWEGPASEAFVANRATPNARDADALAQIDRDLAQPFTAWSDGITAAKDWMERAKQAAREGELTVLRDAIYPPKAFTAKPPAPLDDTPPTADKEAHAQASAEFEAAKALHAKQQAAFDEAKALVQHARDLERKSHDELRDALTRQTDALKHLGQFKQWSQAAASATTPAAVDLMGLATDLENKSVNATHAAFEKAAAQSPYATHSMWSVLTSEQRADLISRYPQMVGSTNGVPAVDRDIANRSILAAQKASILKQLDDLKDSVQRTNAKGMEATLLLRRQDELNQALEGLNELEQDLSHRDKFLLGIDADANDRGQVIIASGNPDTANNTLTLVPGTFSDLGDAHGYVENNDAMLRRAHELDPNSNTAAVVWADYQSPQNLGEAAFEASAEQAHGDLSEFQEGLRATHDPEFRSHNILMGHSYGSTVAGYASANNGSYADDIVFFGSPGVGVDHASQLDVGAENVWSGTAGDDNIEDWAPSANLIDWGTDVVAGEDHHRFGRDPSSREFGGNIIPTDPDGGHGDYWQQRESMNGMARIVVGDERGSPK